MQTRQKVITRTLDKERAIPKSTRHQRKSTFSAENKNAELITSSARKTKCAVPQKKSRDVEAPRPLNARSLCDGHQILNKANGTSLAHKQADVQDEHCVLDSIFSPVFHITKDSCDSIHDNETATRKCKANPQDHITGESKVGAFGYSVSTRKKSESSIYDRPNVDEPSTCPVVSTRSSDDTDMQSIYGSLLHSKAAVNKSYHEEFIVTGDLSPEVSAIYLAMQSSKLECVDEPCHDSMSTDDYMEADEGDEYDDFDPYLFIRNLPDLSSVVPTFRPMLLPKKTRSCPSTSLVLDLDETLVHSSLEACEDADFTFPVNFNLKDHTVYVRCRPYLKDFLEKVSSLFEIIIFTASQSIYAEQLLNVLDPKRKLFRHRVYRESCVYVDGNYLKDLSILGRDLAHIIIIDNSPQAFGFQVDNGIPIESWFDDRSDRALLSLLPFLETLVGVDDVRPLIAKKFNIRDKIAGAAYPSLLLSKRAEW